MFAHSGMPNHFPICHQASDDLPVTFERGGSLLVDFLRRRINGERCVYCGSRSESDEHFPPESYGDFGYILPACRECNSLAGTAYPTSFVERAKFVQEKLRSRAPRFTFSSELTIADVLALPEESWIGQLQAEREKIAYRERVAWDALAYVATLTKRKLPFVSDLAPIAEEYEASLLAATISPEESSFIPLEEMEHEDQVLVSHGPISDEEEDIDMVIANSLDDERYLAFVIRKLRRLKVTLRPNHLIDGDDEFLSADRPWKSGLSKDEKSLIVRNLRHDMIWVSGRELETLSPRELGELVARVL